MGDILPFVDLGNLASVMSLSTGDYHVCAVLEEPTGGSIYVGLKCWGFNGSGELG